MKHFWYIVRHKWFVMIECFKMGLIWQGITHDLDKFRIGYFKSYKEYEGSKGYKSQLPETLYPKTGSRALNKEILRHKKRSPHHWQYYCYGRKEPSPIPDKYIKEMVCDWIGAGKARGRKDLMGWYLESKDLMVINNDTKEKLNNFINKLK